MAASASTPLTEAGAGTDDEPVGVHRPHRQARQLSGHQRGLGGGGVEVKPARGHRPDVPA